MSWIYNTCVGTMRSRTTDQKKDFSSHMEKPYPMYFTEVENIV